MPDRTARGLDLNTATALGDLFHSLSHSPKTRRAIAKVLKEADDVPEAKGFARQFADVEQVERQEAWERQQEERELERRGQAAVEKMARDRAALLAGDEENGGRRYSEDEVKGIEALMQKRGIASYPDAAILYGHENPPTDPRPHDEPPHGTTWEFPEFNKFKDDPVRASRDVANDVIAELNRRRR